MSVSEKIYIEETPSTTNIYPEFASNIEHIRIIVEKLADEMKVEQDEVIKTVKNTLDPDNKYGLQYYQAIKGDKNNQLKERIKWVKILISYHQNNSQKLEEVIRKKLLVTT
ncbi:hypothetical protein [Calothrix sp. CCY 0018]|uniref:hypothetical protein n=1 Tax=Calothrix sp. CCY 0018 TaxID=3103864 RepID=UPI0039C5C674